MTMEAAGGGLNGTSALNASSAPAKFQRTSTENYGPQINFTIWLLTALSAMFLALRVYCKFLRHRGLWWDDHILIASWVSDSSNDLPSIYQAAHASTTKPLTPPSSP